METKIDIRSMVQTTIVEEVTKILKEKHLMKQIRHNVFETNSSSVHAITMCLESIYDKWQNDELYFYDSTYKLPKGRDKFFTWDDMIEFMRDVLCVDAEDLQALIEAKENENEEFEQLLHDSDFYTADMYENYNSDCECYAEVFTTPLGERVCAFGYAGARY